MLSLVAAQDNTLETRNMPNHSIASFRVYKSLKQSGKIKCRYLNIKNQVFKLKNAFVLLFFSNLLAIYCIPVLFVFPRIGLASFLG